jgi:hypothetical protein
MAPAAPRKSILLAGTLSALNEYLSKAVDSPTLAVPPSPSSAAASAYVAAFLGVVVEFAICVFCFRSFDGPYEIALMAAVCSGVIAAVCSWLAGRAWVRPELKLNCSASLPVR